jgi:hypothetical protein
MVYLAISAVILVFGLTAMVGKLGQLLAMIVDKVFSLQGSVEIFAMSVLLSKHFLGWVNNHLLTWVKVYKSVTYVKTLSSAAAAFTAFIIGFAITRNIDTVVLDLKIYGIVLLVVGTLTYLRLEERTST